MERTGLMKVNGEHSCHQPFFLVIYSINDSNGYFLDAENEGIYQDNINDCGGVHIMRDI